METDTKEKFKQITCELIEYSDLGRLIEKAFKPRNSYTDEMPYYEQI